MQLTTQGVDGASFTITDIGWQDGSRHGSDIIRVDRLTKKVTVLVKLAWDPVYSDGWRRFAWVVTSRPEAAFPELMVLASPEVQVEPTPPVTQGSAYVSTSIVRLQAADFVPQFGEPVRLGSLLPTRSPIVLASSAADSSNPLLRPPSDPAVPIPTVPLVDEAAVQWLPDGAQLRHQYGHWVVRIKVDQRAAHGFAFELDAAPAAGNYALARSAFTLRIAHRGAIEVDVQQRSTRIPIHPVLGVVEQMRSSQIDVSIAEDRSRGPLPATGVDVGAARGFRQVKATPLYTDLENLSVNLPVQLTVLALSLAPGSAGAVLGVALLIYELGNLAAAAAFGQDLLGNPVREDQLPTMAAFAIVSVFATGFQIAGAVRAADTAMNSRLVKVAETLAPDVKASEAVETAASLLDRFCSPLVRDALRRMDPKAAQRVLTELEAVVAKADPAAIKRLSAVLNAEVIPLLVNLPRTSGIPTLLYVEAMEAVHVADTAVYAALTPTQQRAAAVAFARARGAADPALLRLADISLELEAEYNDLVRDVIVQKVLGPTMEGFRLPLLQPAILAEGIGTGHTTYTAGKLRLGRRSAELLEWLAAQQSNSRYHSLAQAELGPDFYRNILKPILDSRRYAVDRAAAKFLADHMDTVDDYRSGRELVSVAGLGRLIQLDHLFEQRFLRYMDEVLHLQEDAHTFAAEMVPANRFAAANFRAAGVHGFAYVHTVKTELMRKWVPYGTEGLFTLQELFDTCRLVFVHELKFTDDTFLSMFQADFEFVWQTVRTHADELVAAGEPLEHPRLVEAWNHALDLRPKTRDQLVLSALRPLQR